MNFLKNYRDVGAAVAASTNPVEKDDDIIPPGLLLRSSAWDLKPDIRWEDIGRPRTILNLREYHAASSYGQLIGPQTSDDGDRAVNSSPVVWQISASNDSEKYDLSLSGSRDWLVAVLQRLLEDDGTWTFEIDEDATREGSAGRAEEKCADPDDPVQTSPHRCGFFRSALACLIRRRFAAGLSPLLVHCRFGRDRTGIVVAFLLRLMVPSVPDSVLLDEFLLSDRTCTPKLDGDCMMEKGKMFLELTLKNLPIVFHYIEARWGRIFADQKYRTAREEMVRSIELQRNHPMEFVRLSRFRCDEKYMKVETGIYLKRISFLSQNPHHIIDIDEKQVILWASFAFYYSVHAWLTRDPGQCIENVPEETWEVPNIELLNSQLDCIHMNAAAIQLAKIMIEEGIAETYPLPKRIDKIKKSAGFTYQINSTFGKSGPKNKCISSSKS
mmetsp:Transcript_26715/g.61474  ORF Transcript_26715/g.61474 Transcript_26715/m.61474 type:complete len:441 (-) Transcript_26715:198-1520(-)